MAQRFGATTELRDHAETILDEWEAALANGSVEEHEIVRLTVLIETLPHKAAYVDDTVQTGISWIKNGLESQIVQRRLREHERLHGVTCFEAEKERRRGSNHDDAA